MYNKVKGDGSRRSLASSAVVLASSRDASRDRRMGEFDSFLLDSFSSSFHGLEGRLEKRGVWF